MYCITKKNAEYEIIICPDYRSWASVYDTLELAEQALEIVKGSRYVGYNNRTRSDSTYERWKETNRTNKDDTNKKTTKSYKLKGK